MRMTPGHVKSATRVDTVDLEDSRVRESLLADPSMPIYCSRRLQILCAFRRSKVDLGMPVLLADPREHGR
ncbi:hypothetical protein BURPS305_1908 [Burkholderia pseudomallei 305]|nr:hypothetical protein BURPS305_1908 [Burkholderia pseudomallei 305]